MTINTRDLLAWCDSLEEHQALTSADIEIVGVIKHRLGCVLRGRPRTYHSEQERLAARAAAARKCYYKKQEAKQ